MIPIPSQKPIDMKNPSMNDILKYEVYSVSVNKFMTDKEKRDKIIELKAQLTNQIDE